MTNAIRHTQARRIAVRLTLDRPGTRPVLSVSDDGRGVHAEAVAGRGLRGIKERTIGLGGSCAIKHEAGQGTCLRVVIPLPDQLPAVADAVSDIG
jgi:signal transduction histidine kinase